MEGSRKRLRLDRIDLYLLQVPDPVVPVDASAETLAQLRNEEKIRLVGLSNVTQGRIERARKIDPIVMLPIAGTSSVEHLEENGAAASVRLAAEEYE